MKQEEHRILVNSRLLDLDIENGRGFVGITEAGELITADGRARIVHPVVFPMVRWLGDEEVLLVSSRTEDQVPNAFVLDREGKLVRSFWVGDGVHDICVRSGKVVVGYFDEGVFGSEGPNNSGLAVFDKQGRVEFTFPADQQRYIYDCYCLCPGVGSTVMFHPYDTFDLVELDLDTFKWRHLPTPEELHGSNAIAFLGPQVIFHSPYASPNGLFAWEPSTGATRSVGAYSNRLRGLSHGRFLSLGDGGFTVVSPIEHHTGRA